jgi:hypothetical protein
LANRFFKNAIDYKIWVIMMFFKDGPEYVNKESAKVETDYFNEALEGKAWWLDERYRY